MAIEGRIWTGDSLDRFRGYLRTLAEVELDHRLRRKVDPSDLVQETLLNAYKAIRCIQGRPDEEVTAWLRKILARKVANTIRDHGRDKRDFRMEKDLEGALNRSSRRLQFLAKSEETASKKLERKEVLVRVASALNDLPEDQRRAVILKHLQDESLAEIAVLLGRTSIAVAGLLRRGLKNLRKALQDL